MHCRNLQTAYDDIIDVDGLFFGNPCKINLVGRVPIIQIKQAFEGYKIILFALKLTPLPQVKGISMEAQIALMVIEKWQIYLSIFSGI